MLYIFRYWWSVKLITELGCWQKMLEKILNCKWTIVLENSGCEGLEGEILCRKDGANYKAGCII